MGATPFMTSLLLGDILRVAAHPTRSGHKPALLWGDQVFTYAEANAAVNRAAHALLDLGVRHGDRVAILARNCPQYVWLYFALAKLGAIAVPVNFWYRAGEVEYTLRQSGATSLLYDTRFAAVAEPAARAYGGVVRTVTWEPDGRGQLADLMAAAPATEPDVPVQPEDPHIILYTSGTTGFPKGALFSQRAHYLHAVAWALMTHQHQDDVGLLVYPLFHTGGPDCVLLPHFLVGGTVVLLDGADPREMLEAVQRHCATNVFCVPTVWRRLLAAQETAPADVSSVRRCLGSSDTLPPDLLDSILRAFPAADVYVTYGLTEAGCILTYSHLTRGRREKIASVGRPHPLVELRLLDPDGSEVPPGEVGEVAARGPTLMAGYWDMPERTAEALRDGWLCSGDLGRFDEDGYLVLAGRAKDMIVSGGEKIYPIEVERLIKQFPGVAEAALVGVPDPVWGESVLACVVPQMDAGGHAVPIDSDALRQFVRQRLAGYKTPRYVELLDALPVTTATGKVQKSVLRDRFREKYSGTP